MSDSFKSAAETLNGLPRHALGFTPTPLMPLHRITVHCGGPQIWIKRDDCTGLATGGNKTRKLEFLLGQALALGCDTLISQGALQSNHARQVAAAGAAAGMKVHLLLCDAVPGRTADYTRVGNTQLCRLLGAELHFLDGDADADAYSAELARKLRSEGATPYEIPLGGSNGVGALGYAVAFAEIAQQMNAMNASLDAVAVASGSGGTQAGLMLGGWMQSWQGPVIGVSVGPTQEVLHGRVSKALAEAAQLLGLPDSSQCSVALDIEMGFKGPQYGLPDAQTLQALELMARSEGIVLDPVYSAKGFAGLLQACSPGGALHSLRNVVFVHTGGAAAMSAYPEAGI